MPSRIKKNPEPAPVVIEVITETTAKPAKEVKHVKEIEAKPVKSNSVPLIRTKAKAPKSPYTAYISKNFKEYKGTGKSNGEIFKELAKAWGGMSPEQKAGYKV